MLKPLFIEATQESPRILLDNEKNIFIFEGISIPENSAVFYQPVIDWLTKFEKEEYEKNLEIHFKIKYYNSSSYARISRIFALLDECFKSGKNIKILWYFHPADETTKEDGLEFQKHHSVPTELIIFEN